MTKISNQYSLTNVLFADAVNGRVGIGTATPSRTLSVKNSSDGANGISFQSYASTTEMAYIRYEQTNDRLDIINTSSYASGGIALKTNSTERILINSSGYVSINSAITSNGLVNIKQIGTARYGGINVYDESNNTFLGLGNTGSLCIIEANYNTGSYTPLTFYTGGSERIRITTGGSVGIGTTFMPYGSFVVKSNSTTAYHGINVFATGNSNFAFINHDNNVGIIGTEFGTGGTGHTPLTFQSGGAERMRINTNGKAQIKANASDYSLTVVNSSTNCYGVYINYSAFSPNSTNFEFLACSDSTQDKLLVWSNGSVVNRTGSYGTISDIKFKENIVDATPKLADLLNLKVRNFNLKGEDTKQIGFIAQEFEEVFPAMVDVSKEKDSDETYKSIKTSVLVPMLVKAIQELSAQASEQQLQINELKALLNA